MISEQTIQQAAQLLWEAAKPAKVILFGSYARGDAQENSDQDFLVIEPELQDKFHEMLEVLPPAAMSNGGFLVGEPWDHHALTGAPRYGAYKQINSQYYVANRPLTKREFKEEVQS